MLEIGQRWDMEVLSCLEVQAYIAPIPNGERGRYGKWGLNTLDNAAVNTQVPLQLCLLPHRVGSGGAEALSLRSEYLVPRPGYQHSFHSTPSTPPPPDFVRHVLKQLSPCFLPFPPFPPFPSVNTRKVCQHKAIVSTQGKIFACVVPPLFCPTQSPLRFTAYIFFQLSASLPLLLSTYCSEQSKHHLHPRLSSTLLSHPRPQNLNLHHTSRV